MRNGILVLGVPVPKGDKILLSELAIANGVGKYPPKILRDPAFRSANDLVEIQSQTYDSKFEYLSDAIDSYTDLGAGVWQENQTILIKSLVQLQNFIIQVIHNKRKEVLRGGITLLGKSISTDSGDIDKYTLISAALSTGTPYPTGGIKVFTMEGERVQVSAANFAVLMKALADHFYLTDNNADIHMSAIEALTTQQELIDYDISTGWPANPPPIEQGV